MPWEEVCGLFLFIPTSPVYPKVPGTVIEHLKNVCWVNKLVFVTTWVHLIQSGEGLNTKHKGWIREFALSALRVFKVRHDHPEALLLQIKARLWKKYRKGAACLQSLSSPSGWHSDATILSPLLGSLAFMSDAHSLYSKDLIKHGSLYGINDHKAFLLTLSGCLYLFKTKPSDRMFGITKRPLGEISLGKEVHT